MIRFNTATMFPQPGNYFRQLTAANAFGETSRTLASSEPSCLKSWCQAHFGTTSNAGSGDKRFLRIHVFSPYMES